MSEYLYAKRYDWLRKQHWFDGKVCVVNNPKKAVKLGHDCPSEDRLDELIDEFMKDEKMNDTTTQLWQKVKENRDKLNACHKHKFDCPDPPYKLGMKLVCLNCGGEMRGEAIFEYMNGFIAAGGDPNEVIEGWNE